MNETILRHACLACGGSCHGIQVPVLGDEERQRVERLAAELGVAEPIVEGRLRRVDGHCVFLGEDRLCTLHRVFGGASKPRLCQQYPLIVLRADGEVRVGLDPTCYTAIQTWRDGPEVPEGAAVATRVDLPPAEQAWESRFLDLVEEPDATVAGLLSQLTGGGSINGGLPDGFAERWITVLREADFAGFFANTTMGPHPDGLLRPLIDVAQSLDPTTPPPWPALAPESEAWAIEATRRVVWLRMSTIVIPSVPAVAMLLLGGAVLCGWATPDPKQFGAYFAVWIRALRYTDFVRRLIPDGRTLSWLATGAGR